MKSLQIAIILLIICLVSSSKPQENNKNKQKKREQNLEDQNNQNNLNKSQVELQNRTENPEKVQNESSQQQKRLGNDYMDNKLQQIKIKETIDEQKQNESQYKTDQVDNQTQQSQNESSQQQKRLTNDYMDNKLQQIKIKETIDEQKQNESQYKTDQVDNQTQQSQNESQTTYNSQEFHQGSSSNEEMEGIQKIQALIFTGFRDNYDQLESFIFRYYRVLKQTFPLNIITLIIIIIIQCKIQRIVYKNYKEGNYKEFSERFQQPIKEQMIIQFEALKEFFQKEQNLNRSEIEKLKAQNQDLIDQNNSTIQKLRDMEINIRNIATFQKDFQSEAFLNHTEL